MSAYIDYRVQMGVIKRNTKVAMETIGEAKARKAKFASSDEIVVDQLKLSAKNKNTTKSTQTWLNVWGKWANERKFNPKMEYENEDLDKELQTFYTEVCTKDGLFYNFAENFVNKKSYGPSFIS